MKDTGEIIEMLDTWEGLVYEHSLSELEELLLAVEEFQARIKRHKKQEERLR